MLKCFCVPIYGDPRLAGTWKAFASSEIVGVTSSDMPYVKLICCCLQTDNRYSLQKTVPIFPRASEARVTLTFLIRDGWTAGSFDTGETTTYI